MTAFTRLLSISTAVVALCLGASHAALAQAAAPKPLESSATLSRPYQLDFNVRIPMRDGTELSATIYRPAHQSGPLPVILTLTPYTAERYNDVGAYFAAHGYVFASVDVRGRGNSGGTFEPWSIEGPDGYDVIQWLAKQPYSDGQVATWGGSYSGKNQWMIAAQTPPALKVIAPASAGYMDRTEPAGLGMDWLYLIAGKTSNDELRYTKGFWIGAFADRARGETTMRHFDSYVGYPNKYWQDWMNHPANDAYWDAASAPPESYKRIQIPVLSISGQYDPALTGTAKFRELHLAATDPKTAAQSYFVLGPWNHAGSRDPQRALGGLDFGPDAKLDVRALHVAWYDHVMKGAPLPAFLKDRFVYYISGLGSGVWASAPDVASATKRMETLFLSSPTTTAGSLAQAGTLAPAAKTQAPDAYVYDPKAPAYNEGFRGGANVSPTFLTDDRVARRLNGDGLIYETAPLAQAANFVGSPTVDLHISMDVPDTDIQVTFYEVRPDGSSIYLTEDRLRARYRHGDRQEVLVKPGEVDTYAFADFPFVARTIGAGSRIRMVVTPEGSSIYAEHNRNSGGVVVDETPADSRVAHVSVMLGGKAASKITLPWG